MGPVVCVFLFFRGFGVSEQVEREQRRVFFFPFSPDRSAVFFPPAPSSKHLFLSFTHLGCSCSSSPPRCSRRGARCSTSPASPAPSPLSDGDADRESCGSRSPASAAPLPPPSADAIAFCCRLSPCFFLTAATAAGEAVAADAALSESARAMEGERKRERTENACFVFFQSAAALGSLSQ